MINAYRRGVQTAAEKVLKYPSSLPVEEIRNIAKRTFADMRQAGFAHIEPEEDFTVGFVERFQQLQHGVVLQL